MSGREFDEGAGPTAVAEQDDCQRGWGVARATGPCRCNATRFHWPLTSETLWCAGLISDQEVGLRWYIRSVGRLVARARYTVNGTGAL